MGVYTIGTNYWLHQDIILSKNKMLCSVGIGSQAAAEAVSTANYIAGTDVYSPPQCVHSANTAITRWSQRPDNNPDTGPLGGE